MAMSCRLSRDGIALSYEILGQGPAVLLVQGLGLPGKLWLGLPAGLARMGYRVIVPDNRGSGVSDTPQNPYGIADMADDLAALLADAEVTHALVVGVSLGGMIAQELALRHPQRVSGLILGATSCGLPCGIPSSAANLSAFAGALLDPSRVDDLARLGLHSQTLASHPQILAAWHDCLVRYPDLRPRRGGIVGQLAAAAGHNCGARLNQISCPVEVISPDEDQIIPAQNGLIIHQAIAGSRHTQLKIAGHAFALEHPSALPLAIRRMTAPSRALR